MCRAGARWLRQFAQHGHGTRPPKPGQPKVCPRQARPCVRMRLFVDRQGWLGGLWFERLSRAFTRACAGL